MISERTAFFMRRSISGGMLLQRVRLADPKTDVGGGRIRENIHTSSELSVCVVCLPVGVGRLDSRTFV